FSGKGLVPDSVAASPEFLAAVAAGAGLTVMLAAWAGFPISTTHSLTGGLVGAGLAAVGLQVKLKLLGSAFVLPLLISPLIAVALAAAAYVVFREIRRRSGLRKETCLCVEEPSLVTLSAKSEAALDLSPLRLPSGASWCEERYRGDLAGVNAQKVLDTAHYLSSGVVSFARGLNDTPKIVALLLGAQALQLEWSLLMVGLAMAIGGLLSARNVAETMSRRITGMNAGQGFTANLCTGFLVVFASRLGVPVSTTHVAVGSLFGIGTVTGQADYRVIREILLSWVLTLPVSASFSAVAYAIQ
ncbi:MAG: inorganic phosphate transporter, partial [Acidobacteriota bacterium]